MGIHPNARLTPIGRERLIRQHLDEDTSLAQLAAGHVSANAPSASGWRAFVQAGQRHWRIERAPHKAADARSAATAAGRGPQAPAWHPPENRQVAAGADQQPGPGDAPPPAKEA